jgi:hypothetical protein
MNSLTARLRLDCARVAARLTVRTRASSKTFAFTSRPCPATAECSPRRLAGLHLFLPTCGCHPVQTIWSQPFRTRFPILSRQRLAAGCCRGGLLSPHCPGASDVIFNNSRQLRWMPKLCILQLPVDYFRSSTRRSLKKSTIVWWARSLNSPASKNEPPQTVQCSNQICGCSTSTMRIIRLPQRGH